MNSESSAESTYALKDLLAEALMLGLAGGLLEGVADLVLQRFGFLANVWYQILWIAPVFNGFLLGGLALLLAGALSFLPERRWARLLAIGILMFVAMLPVLVTTLKEWIQPYAIVVLTAGISMVLARWFKRHEQASLRFCRRALRPVAALALLVFVAVEGGFWLRERVGVATLPPASASAPDILLIVVDTLRADHLSSYGYERQTSPIIDRLAAGGVLFEQAFATSSYTLPSHASILTGLYPSQHKVEWGTARRQATASYPTLAETLKNRGYRTGAFSANTFWFTRAQGFGRGFLHFDDFFSSVSDMALRTAYGRIAIMIVRRLGLGFKDIPARKRAPEINRAVVDWLDLDLVHPSFTVVNYMDVHDPYLPPQPFRSKFSKQSNPGGLLHWEMNVPDALTPEQLQGEIDAYDGAVAFVDNQIGQLLTSLQQQHRARELLVVITSDHGEEFGEHGHYLHGHHLYREVIRVPLILWSPGRVPAGVRVSQPVTNAAIPSTIMNVLESGDRTFPGPALQRLWEAREAPSDYPFPVAELKRRPWEPERAPVRHGSLRSFVSPLWHYIEHDTRGIELYRWVDDPRETVDLAKEPSWQDVIEDFRRRYMHNVALLDTPNR